jgi:adenylate cyclase
MSAFRLSTLGGVRCTTDAGELHSVTAQPRRVALLVYLALAQPRGFHSRDQLLALFWPDHDEQRARNTLSQAVHFLRRSLGADTLVNAGDDQLRLTAELVSCDVIEFEAALAAGRTPEALELYRGPFLEGFHISAAAAELDRWVDNERDRLSRLYAGALDTMARECGAAGDFVGAVQWHRHLAVLDPLSSRIALGLIRALAAAGDTPGALQHARVYETMSRAELDAQPDPAITSFVTELRRRMATAAPELEHADGLTSGTSSPAVVQSRVVESLPPVSAPSGVGVTERRRRQAMIAVVGVLAASLAFVPIANRKHAEATSRIDCVAVLPIENLSADSTLDHFADAMTAATITELEKYDAPDVRSRSSVLSFKASRKSLPEIGRALKCDAIIEASVTRSANVAHIDAKILYAPDDRQLWAESFEEDTSRMLVFERRVIDMVTRHVRTLAGHSGGNAEASRRVDPFVYSVYLRGRDAYRRWNATSVRDAVALYKQAIAIDSTFAPAYAGLADAYNLMAGQGYGPLTYWDSARTLVERALAIDSMSSEAHTTKGYILTNDGHWTGAEAEFKRAIELDEKNAFAHHWYGVLLALLNRKEEALQQSRRASELDPTSQEIQSKRTEIQFFAGVEARLGNLGRVEAMADPNNPAVYAVRAVTFARKGRCAEAYQENQHAQELAPNNSIMLAGLVLVHQACKDSSRAKALLAQLKRRPDAKLMALYIAMPHVAAHEPDSAFVWLEQSRWGVQTYWLLRTSKFLDPLRSDPRFPELLRSLHLP